MTGPLQGLRVLELAQYVAGPLCGRVLRDLGAEVIKVEPPGGDGYRRVMPVGEGLGRFFLPLNQGKRSVVLDLKTEAGRASCACLVDRADVVIHNYPAARAAAFGLEWDALHERRPALVMGVVTSFGAVGPLAGSPAYDLVAQARSGLLTSHASAGDGVPVRAGGIPMADLTAGLLLAPAVLAALVRARADGVGDRVEVSLLQAALAIQVQDLVWLPGEAEPEARVARRTDLAARAQEIALGLDTNPYYRCFEAADGYLAVACLNLAQRVAFLELFGLEDGTIEAPDLIPEDAGSLEAKRVVTSAVADRLRLDTVEAWSSRLAALGVPSGPVYARESVAAETQAVANGLVGVVTQPGLGDMSMLAALIGAGSAAPAPLLGADTNAVLAEIGA